DLPPPRTSLTPPPLPPLTHTLSLHDALPIYAGDSTSSDRGDPGDPQGRLSCGAQLRRPRWRRPAALGSVSSSRLACRHRGGSRRSEEHTSELQSRFDLVCRLLLEK